MARKIERELVKYPAEQSNRSAGRARVAQDEHGWLSRELMEEVAAVLQMPAIAVYEVASFYTMYNTAPSGASAHDLHNCHARCRVRTMPRATCKQDWRRFNETTRTGRFTLKEGESWAHVATHRCLVNNKRMCSLM